MSAFSISLPDERATDQLGATLAARLRIGDVVGLKGELGAGKTTLARAILRAAAEDAQLIVPWDPLESTCRHASLSIL